MTAALIVVGVLLAALAVLWRFAYTPDPDRRRAYPREPELWPAPPARRAPRGDRKRVLFIGGSPNQTTQMHQIASQLPDVDAWFTPYFSDLFTHRLALKFGFLEMAILGHRRRGLCLDYLNAHGLRVDLGAERNTYDLVVTCNDQVLPRCLRGVPMVLVQEGIQDPPDWRTALWRATRLVPRPLTGTSTFGLTKAYEAFCVASEGYRQKFLALGIPAEKLRVTGIPNFDSFERFRDNDFPHHGFVLVCTTDARETLAQGDRDAFLRDVVAIAAGRPLLFKLHPNEKVLRATEEFRAVAPDALVLAEGCAEEMVANCDVLITEWSSLTFCGLALGKEVHSHHPIDEVRALLPLQHGRAAQEIAGVIDSLLRQRVQPHAAPVATEKRSEVHEHRIAS